MPARIAYPFEGASIGGGPISTLETVQSLDPTAFQPICILHNPDGPLAEYLSARDIAFEPLPLDIPQRVGDILSNPLRYLKAIYRARNFIRVHNIDIVQTDDGPLRYIWFYAAKWAGVRFVLTQSTLLRLTLEKRIAYRFIDAIIVNSRACQASLPPLPKRVVQDLCHPPIQIPDLPTPKQKSSTTEKEPRKKIIGFLANIHPRKRPEVFVDMAAILERKHPDKFQFVMAGGFTDGMEDKIHAQIHRLGLEGKIQMLGFCDDPFSVLSRFHVLIASSVEEAFGRNLVESMALGVPVIASNDGGHKEIIEEGKSGFLVPIEDAQAFAEKVELLSDPATYNQISTAAIARAKLFYGKSPAPFFSHLYQTLLKQGHIS